MIRTCPSSIAAVVVASTVLWTCDAAAQTSSGSQAMAEALFQDAWKLVDAGKVTEACLKFAESNRVDPKLGTLVALANCHERDGKTASAWVEFTQALTAATRSGDDKRAAYAREHAKELEKKLSRVVIEVVAPEQHPVIQLDGAEIGAAAWGSAIPLDPGDHLLGATASGKVAWSSHVVVPRGPATSNVRVPTLGVVVATEGPSPVVPTPARDDGANDKPSAWTPRRIGGVALVGAGVVGLAVGTVFGVRTFSDKSAGEKDCHGDACTATGVSLIGQAHDAATVSTIAFAAGAALVAGGVIIVITARPKSGGPAVGSLFVAPSFDGHGGSLGLAGSL